MGFAEADITVYKERVIGAPRILADLQCRRPRQLVGAAFHVFFEGVIRVHDAALVGLRRAAVPCRQVAAGGGADDGGSGRVSANFNLYQADIGGHPEEGFLDHAEQVFLDVIEDVTVGRQQFQRIIPVHRMQRLDPFIDVGHRNPVPQLVDTINPDLRHAQKLLTLSEEKADG